jgi:hypothetical protein
VPSNLHYDAKLWRLLRQHGKANCALLRSLKPGSLVFLTLS